MLLTLKVVRTSKRLFQVFRLRSIPENFSSAVSVVFSNCIKSSDENVVYSSEDIRASSDSGLYKIILTLFILESNRKHFFKCQIFKNSATHRYAPDAEFSEGFPNATLAQF